MKVNIEVVCSCGASGQVMKPVVFDTNVVDDKVSADADKRVKNLIGANKKLDSENKALIDDTQKLVDEIEKLKMEIKVASGELVIGQNYA